MNDAECVDFLRWALPRMHRRWEGFRRVHRTTCKRIERRLERLALPKVSAYRRYLQREPDEWFALAALLPITISSFYRDKAVYDFLGNVVLLDLAAQAARRGAKTLYAWSIGCASGEEPYTLMLVWRFGVQPSLARPTVALRIVATDVETAVLDRARAGCYGGGSLKQLPPAWRAHAFTQDAEGYRLRPEYREGIAFVRQDVCSALPTETFDLILCRNLVLTYFDEPLQRETLQRILTRLRVGGCLVVGRREVLPPHTEGLTGWSEALGVFRKTPSEVRRSAPS